MVSESHTGAEAEVQSALLTHCKEAGKAKKSLMVAVRVGDQHR